MKVSIAALAFAVSVVACSERSTDATQKDLQRDLELASATTMNLAGRGVDSALLNSMETKPSAVHQPTTTVKKGAGNRAVRSQTPTVLATPDIDVAAVEEVAETQTESVAPSPEPTSEPVAVAPRPVPVSIPAAGGGDYGTGNGGGIFGGGSGRGGVVIRGGGVDGDNCDLHRRPGTTRGPIYMPSPTVPRTGGIFIGGGTSPIGNRTNPVAPRPPQSSTRQGGLAGMRSRMR